MSVSKTAGIAVGASVLAIGAVLALVIPSRGPAPAKGFPGGPTASTPTGRAERAAPKPGGSKEAQSPYMQTLLRHKASKNWVEFGVLAFNEAERASPDDRISTLDLLAEHQASGAFPALFCIARHHWFSGHKDEACRWYLKASVVYAIDAQRCTDGTSRQAVQAVRGHFGPLTEHLKQVGAQIERQWIQEALEFEDVIADREPPRWIAAHGLAAFKATASSAKAPEAFVPDEQWRAVRERERASIAASLAK